MKPDGFPITRRTWYAETLDAGESGRQEVNKHVMSVYFEPLRVYLAGHSLRWIGDPKDLISGFFASRLGRASFYEEWQRSGKRFRHWLMNAFTFYLRESSRACGRDRKVYEETLPEESVASRREPGEELDRQFARSVVRHALQATRDICVARALDDHWTIFSRYRLGGESGVGLAAEFGISRDKARNMRRIVEERFRRVLRGLLMRDGVGREEIDQEIQNLLELTAS